MTVSTKENGQKFMPRKVSTRKKQLLHHPSLLSSTQTSFFPNRNHSELNSPGPLLNPFYQTLGSNNFMPASRPESKQAYRKQLCRPETSKGMRPMEKTSTKWQKETKSGYFQ